MICIMIKATLPILITKNMSKTKESNLLLIVKL